MAVSSQPVIRELRGWKAQTCAHCRCAYRVLLRETSDEANHTDSAALRAMSRRVLAAPCPACGFYQPDLLSQRRRGLHLAALLAASTIYGAVLALVENQHLALIAGQYLLVAVGLASFLTHACILRIDPNRDRERGIAEATRLLGEGSLQMLPGEPTAAPPRAAWRSCGVLSWLVLALMLLAVPAAALAEGCRRTRGWPVNEGCQPFVVGDGDSARITFSQTVTSIKGSWKAVAKARVVNAADLGLASDTLEVETQSAPWDRTIQARTSQKNVRSNLWVRVHLPRGLNGQGRRLRLAISMRVCYPDANSSNTQRFNDRFRAFDLQADLDVADPGAGVLYQLCWRIGSIASAAVLLLGGAFFLLQARRLARLALPGAVKLLPAEASKPSSAPS